MTVFFANIYTVQLYTIQFRGGFPGKCKRARLLIPNPEKRPDKPISLLCAMSKVYEYLIKQRLVEELELQGRLAERQFGFRKSRSTVEALQFVVEK